ncbi:hypothetical protein [Nocardia sp. NPDC051463]|uniref:hypothetical protein n=1 Tax=Nocardia sp. NPDC051463 TaxID=3154845 RepID=UPI00344D1B9B
MNRINIYATDEFNGERTLEGWFDLDKADEFPQCTRWDGNNNVSLVTDNPFEHERLYRTAKGRWVIQRYSDRQGRETTYKFVTPDRAREWLLINGRDTDVADFFGVAEPERGPGRPEVGAPINVRLEADLLSRVDTYAASEGIARAAAIRQLLATALAAPSAG